MSPVSKHFCNSPKVERVIVGGSGPSLSRIDYRRYPVGNIAVWRINNFFKEQKYYLGRRVDAVFNGGNRDEISARQDVMQKLADAGIYDINFDNFFTAMPMPNAKNHFAEIELLDSALHVGIWPVIAHARDTHDRHLFSGVAAIVRAILEGFREIYIAGIDCDYESGPRYAYSAAKTSDADLQWIKSYHPTDFQWDIIKQYMDKFNVKIYSLSPESPAARIFPLAPITGNTEFTLTEKTQNENI